MHELYFQVIVLDSFVTIFKMKLLFFYKFWQLNAILALP